MNGARVVISKNLLAEMLGYHEGIVHRVREPEEFMNPKDVYLYIEHPDLPLIEESMPAPEVSPLIEVKYYKNGRYSYKRLD